MLYSIEHNRCEGWFRCIHQTTGSKSAKHPYTTPAYAAIHTHYDTGKWPPVVSEQEVVQICDHCGQSIPAQSP